MRDDLPPPIAPPHCLFTLLLLTALLIRPFVLQPLVDSLHWEGAERGGWLQRGLETVYSEAPVSGAEQSVVHDIVHLSLHELNGQRRWRGHLLHCCFLSFPAPSMVHKVAASIELDNSALFSLHVFHDPPDCSSSASHSWAPTPTRW